MIERQGSVGGYATDTQGHHSVNGYWIEGEDGLILIDAHWRLSDAQRAFEAMRTVSDKPIAAVIITHPHSDHFGGLPVFLDAAEEEGEPAEYYASAWTARSIANDEQGFLANRRDQFGDDFPATMPQPTHLIEDGSRVTIAGVDLEFTILRQNEAVETVLIHLPAERALFTGDIVNSETLPVLYQGGLDSWIAQIYALRSHFPDVVTIFPGHGAPGNADDLIEDEIAVLEIHRDEVAAALEDDGTVDAVEREAIKDAIESRFPSWRTTAGIPARRDVIERNIDWILRGWRVDGAGEGQAAEFRTDGD
ncbi:MBL fold metallo-hydrolase [uncultured Roseobacter sp.]|uniref:MBL fold metallo-hydrolase n=1 Tax=uncultured Roseobacter sp. TaxID=114847 RepID=UPI002601A4A8|nr:MBL fold metallo-hydrolase [uncultured Roseobacter sp.]